MSQRSLQQVRHRLEAAVRVRPTGKALARRVVLGTHVVEQEEDAAEVT